MLSCAALIRVDMPAPVDRHVHRPEGYLLQDSLGGKRAVFGHVAHIIQKSMLTVGYPSLARQHGSCVRSGQTRHCQAGIGRQGGAPDAIWAIVLWQQMSYS
jgi:hypothetical protein